VQAAIDSMMTCFRPIYQRGKAAIIHLWSFFFPEEEYLNPQVWRIGKAMESGSPIIFFLTDPSKKKK